MRFIFLKKVSFRYLALLSISGLLLAFYYILHNSYKGDIRNYKNSRIDELNISYNAIVNLNHRTSELLYETVVNSPQTWNILAKANSGDTAIVNQARQDLYMHLKEHYHFLSGYDIRQLHFHLPNNHSFLRFHRPGKYGDDLSQVRYSIAETNRTLKSHWGFEEGRIFNGFRYVFPIINDKDKHLGSVEVSINFKAIQRELYKLHPKTYAFYIKKDIVNSKVFKSELNNYCTTKLSPDLLCESYQAKDSIINSINNTISKKVKDKISNFESFSYIHRCKKTYRATTFLPIKNVRGNNSAYIVAYEEDNMLKYIYLKYIAIIFFSVILLAFIADLLFQLRQNNLKLEKNEALLIQSNETKDKFFSIIAHDIKGPVSSSVELIRLLKDNYQSIGEEKRTRSLNVIFNSLTDTYKLLINLLHWSRTQRGTIDFKPQELNLAQLSEESIAPLLQLANNKDIRLTTKLNKDHKVKADHDMLSTIIRNLVSNAIKFTPHWGTITVESEMTSPSFITISVKDSGLGIPQKSQAHLLDIDKESSTKGTDNESGTGLGLILCKEFVNYHKGEIWFESETNKGTTFFFTMPSA